MHPHRLGLQQYHIRQRHTAHCVLNQDLDKQPRSSIYSMRIHNVARNAKWVSEWLSALCRRTQYVFDAFDVVILEHVRSDQVDLPSKQAKETRPRLSLLLSPPNVRSMVVELTWRSHTRASQRAVTPVVGVSEQRDASVSKS